MGLSFMQSEQKKIQTNPLNTKETQLSTKRDANAVNLPKHFSEIFYSYLKYHFQMLKMLSKEEKG